MTRVTVLAALSCLLHVAMVYGQESRGVVYDFTATWCGPCQQVAPVVEKLQREGLPIVKVDVDQHPEMQSRFGVQSIPTFILVIDGKEVDRSTGRMSESELRRMAARVPTPSQGNAQPAPSQTRPGLIPIDLGSPAPLARPAPAPVNPPAVEETRVAETEQKRATTLRDLLPFGRKDKTETQPEVVRGNDSVVGNSAQGSASVAANAESGPVDPMKASVRIRVITNGRIDLGSGTVVSSQPGISQILTCAHIFNGFNDDSRIEVDVFENGRPSQFLARLVKFDKDSDLGLISIPTTTPVSTAKVATVTNNPKVSDEVAAIGCSGGDEPTRQQARVTDIDKYEGPHNLLCTGVPVRGRSGGGLFNRQGDIVGVCSAADEKDQRGFYSGLLAMHKLLDQCSLAHLYAAPVAETAVAATETPASREFPASMPATTEAPSSPFGELQPAAPASKSRAVAAAEEVVPAASGVAANPVDVQSGNAEVVVIVRDRANPAQNRVVILHQASPKFMSYLNGELPEGGMIDANLLGASQMENVPGVRRNERTTPSAVAPAMASQSVPAVSVPAVTTTKETLLPTTISQPVVPRKFSRSGTQSRIAQ
ncbi:thioredoxin domain-containing protein [Planctomicrobium sp. SH527]|uniref:thioredoxin domain-containing protein n=1 Tax=Planctomicrobium sp. SH527 TaxID=3448123 RepID=UPI003F5CB40F